MFEGAEPWMVATGLVAAAAVVCGLCVRSKLGTKGVTSKWHAKGKLWRRLFSLEHVYLQLHELGLRSSDMHCVYKLEGSGITPAIVRQVIFEMAMEQAVLQAGAHKEGNDWWFHKFDPTNLEKLVQILSEDFISEAHLSNILNELTSTIRPLNEDNLLWSIRILTPLNRSEKATVVIWSVSHAICDGISMMKFGSDLVTKIYRVLKGAPYSPATPTWTSNSMYERILSSGFASKHLSFLQRILPRPLMYAINAATTPKPGMLPPDKPALANERFNRCIFKSVSKEVLSKFHQACKKQQVSVTAGIIGCVLKTCETTLNIDPNNSIAFYIPINLREVASPKESTDQHFCAIAPYDLHGMADFKRTVWQNATQYHEEIHSDKTGHAVRSVAELAEVESVVRYETAGRKMAATLKADPTSRGSFSVSNFGNFKEPEYALQRDGVKWTAFYVQGSSNVLGPFPNFMMTSLDGELFLSFNYAVPLMREELAQLFVKRLVEMMEELGQEDGEAHSNHS